MKTAARPRTLVPVALAAALLTAFLVMFVPLSASAHDALVGSSPAAGTTVETLPSELTLTFSEELITGDGATEVVVTDPAGTTVSTGPATTSGAIVTQPLLSEAVAGGYHVIWKVVSSDGHPTSGEFDFTVTSDSSAPGPEPTPTNDTVVPTETAAPSPSATASAEPSAAPDESSSGGIWIWILSITGILVIAVAAVVAFVLRGRRPRASSSADGTSSVDDSDTPAER